MKMDILLIKLFFNPMKTFQEIKLNEKFSTMSLVLILILFLLNLFLNMPINEIVVTETFQSMNIPPEQLNMMVEMNYKTRYLQLAGTELLYFIMIFFYSFLLYIIIKLFSSISYKKVLQLFIYTYLIVAIGDLVNTSLIYIRGVDVIQDAYDVLLIGVNNFVSVKSVGPTWYTFLSYINPFQIWFVGLLYLGVKTLTNITLPKALTIVFVFWLITILIPSMAVYFSEVGKSNIS